MATDITLISLSDLVRRAEAIVDPDGHYDSVSEFAARYEDDDEPVRGILPSLIERIRWGADEDPPVVMAQAIVLYLAHRLDEFDDEPLDIMRLAAKAEFDGHPPDEVVRWLEEQGVHLR
jgi:hypothetical protein